MSDNPNMAALSRVHLAVLNGRCLLHSVDCHIVNMWDKCFLFFPASVLHASDQVTWQWQWLWQPYPEQPFSTHPLDIPQIQAWQAHEQVLPENSCQFSEFHHWPHTTICPLMSLELQFAHEAVEETYQDVSVQQKPLQNSCWLLSCQFFKCLCPFCLADIRAIGMCCHNWPAAHRGFKIPVKSLVFLMIETKESSTN